MERLVDSGNHHTYHRTAHRDGVDHSGVTDGGLGRGWRIYLDIEVVFNITSGGTIEAALSSHEVPYPVNLGKQTTCWRDNRSWTPREKFLLRG